MADSRVLSGGPVATARALAEHQIVTTPTNDVAPNPVLSRDLAVVIGVLALLEGELMVDEMPEHLTEQLRDRFLGRICCVTPATRAHCVKRSTT